MASPTLDFDLAAEIEALHAEPDWQTGQNAKTLAKYDDLRIVLTALAAGKRLAGHRTRARVSIHTVSGLIRVHVDSNTFELGPGRVLVLDRDLQHEVEAMADSAFLLTMTWSGART